MRSMASGEAPSPSPDGSETMGTSGAPGRGPSELLAVAPAFAALAALAGSRAASAPARPGCDDVVDPKHHDRRVRRRGDGLAPDPNRLDHVLLLHVGDFAAEHVDPRRLVPLLVLLAQLDQDVDRVETRVLREGPWDDLDGVRERFDGDLLAPADSRREVAQGQGNLHRTRTAAGDDLAVLNRDRDDARRVLEGPLELIDHMLGAPAQEDRVRDLDLRVDLGLLDLEGCIDKSDLCVLYLAGHPGVHAFLVDDNAVDQLRVRD